MPPRASFIVAIALVTCVATGDAALPENGAHVCRQEERYMVNVTQYALKNITVRSYQWCFQYPPRCSVIVYKTVNQSQIVEEERVRSINVCCERYRPDPLMEKCVPECVCVNGICNEENKCYCNPGYRGDYCEKECDSSRWGRYCRYHCNCMRGNCDSITGKCKCPSGWIGARCELQCPDGYFGIDCAQQCACEPNTLCNHVDGRCHEKATTVSVPILKKYHTFDAELTSSSTSTTIAARKVDMYLLTTASTTASRVESTTEYLNHALNTPLHIEEILHESKTRTEHDVNIKSSDRFVMKDDRLDVGGGAKGKALDDEVTGTWITLLPEETWADHDEAALENPHVTIVVIASLLLIGLSIVAFVAIRLLKTRAMQKSNMPRATCKNNSIFHSPLPDVPQQQQQQQQQQQRASDTISIQSVCENKEIPKELFYDHPPSTGSYRATISPEPCEIKSNSEPLYAEIPCWKQDELYMNAITEEKTCF